MSDRVIGRRDAAADVVIVNYLSGQVLRACVIELLKFMPEGTHFIFVDNSPDDGAVDGVSKLVSKVTVLSQDSNIGFAAAVNLGVRQGSAPIVLLANPDIAAIDGEFGTVEALFAQYSDAGAVTGRLEDEAGVLMHCRRTPGLRDFFESALNVNRFLPAYARRPSHAMLEWAHDSVRPVENVTGAFLFLRRAAFEDVGPFDDRFFVYWEETDWLLRARKRGWSTLFTPELRLIHLGESSSPESAGHSTLFVESLYRYVRKQFGLSAAMALRTSWFAADLVRLGRAVRSDSRRAALLRRRLRTHVGWNSQRGRRKGHPV